MKINRLLSTSVLLCLLVSSAFIPSVGAITAPVVKWKISTLAEGQVKKLSEVVSTNSTGTKKWAKSGSCVLIPKNRPTTLKMGSTGNCKLTLRIAKSGKYSSRTSSKEIKLATTATTIGQITTTIALAPPLYSVGQTGPAGGKIFYVDMARPVGSQYFEAACAGWSDGICGGSDMTDPTAKWGCGEKIISGADGMAIGTGKQNTSDTVAGCGTYGIAVRLADSLVLGGQSDWFLPSNDELNQMYINKATIGGLASHNYWSSSEANIGGAWAKSFINGLQDPITRSFELAAYVRPVRAF